MMLLFTVSKTHIGNFGTENNQHNQHHLHYVIFLDQKLLCSAYYELFGIRLEEENTEFFL